jgi:Starch binding domain
MIRIGDNETRVTFVIRCRTDFGQRLRIVGDQTEMGGWDTVRATELTTSVGDYPKWRISLTLPVSQPPISVWSHHRVQVLRVRAAPRG